MLVKDETKYCWCEDEVAGEPQDSIKEAIEDYVDNEYNYGDFDSMSREELLKTTIEIGHPSYYAADVDGEQVIWQVVADADSDLEGDCYSYLDLVEDEHLNELSKELSEAFRKWEKRHGYECTQYIVEETKPYRIGDYIDK